MRVFTSVAMLLIAAGLLSAQEGTGWVDLQGGAVELASDSAFKAGPAFGIGIGGWFTDWWGVEGSVLNTQVKFKATGRKGNETHGMISGLFNFNPGGKTFLPFARLGMGVANYQGDVRDITGKRRANFHGGLGVQGFFGANLLGSVELRRMRVGRNSPYRDESAWLLGLGYRWGGRSWSGKAVPASTEPVIWQRPMVEEVPTPKGMPPPVTLLPPKKP